MTASSLTVPVGSPGSSQIAVEIRAHSGRNCTGLFKSYTFTNGMLNGHQQSGSQTVALFDNSPTETAVFLQHKASCADSTVVDSEYLSLTTDLDGAPLAMASDSSGRIFVAIDRKDSGSNRSWLVRQSVDGGTTWTTDDDFPIVINPSPSNSVGKLIVDSSDAVLLTGNQLQGNLKGHVVTSTDGGGNLAVIGQRFYSESGQPEHFY